MGLLWKWLMILLSMLLVIAGLLTFPLPLPIGLPLLLIGPPSWSDTPQLLNNSSSD